MNWFCFTGSLKDGNQDLHSTLIKGGAVHQMKNTITSRNVLIKMNYLYGGAEIS